MNPAANTGVSGGLSGAIVIILNTWFVALHFAAMSPEVATAYMVVLTAAFGYFFHTQTKPSPVAALDAIKAPVASGAASVVALCLAIVFGGVLVGCTATQQAQLQTGVAQAEQDVKIVQPLASDVACADQAAANATTTILTLTGDGAGALSAAKASQITGYLCNGQPAGAIVTVPASDVPAIAALPATS